MMQILVVLLSVALPERVAPILAPPTRPCVTILSRAHIEESRSPVRTVQGGGAFQLSVRGEKLPYGERIVYGISRADTPRVLLYEHEEQLSSMAIEHFVSADFVPLSRERGVFAVLECRDLLQFRYRLQLFELRHLDTAHVSSELMSEVGFQCPDGCGLACIQIQADNAAAVLVSFSEAPSVVRHGAGMFVVRYDIAQAQWSMAAPATGPLMEEPPPPPYMEIRVPGGRTKRIKRMLPDYPVYWLKKPESPESK